MSWKNYLYFTKKERIGLLFFCLIIVLVFSFRFFSSKRFFSKESATVDSVYVQTPVSADSERASRKGEERSKFPMKTRKEENIYVLHDFDPNTADSLTLVRLGLRPYIARNVLKYRSRGGKFRKAEDFSRIYGLEKDQFEQLRPYIKIANAVVSSPAATATPSSKKDSLPPEGRHPARESSASFIRQEKYPLGTTIDINTADTTEWKKVPHVGSSFARRIVKYRNLLGGYHNLEQLREVYGLDQELYDKIRPWLKPDVGEPVKLAVNKLSLERMRAHPYLNFYQAKAIVELRKKKKLAGLSDLQLLEEFSATDLLRLEPYLSFD